MTQEPQTEAMPEIQLAARQFTSSGGLGKLADALAKAQGEIENAKKDAANPFYKSRYADLASVWDACRGPLSKNGLAVIQLPGSNGHGLFVDSILMHSSGEWISGRLFVKPVKEDPQGIGSAVTYARRYGLQALVGIAPEEDDGNAASDIEARQEKREANDATNRNAPLETPNWREIKMPFGNNKGEKLGEMSAKDLAYWQSNYEPKQFKGKISKKDLELRAMLDESMKEARPAAPAPLPLTEPVEDEIPF